MLSTIECCQLLVYTHSSHVHAMNDSCNMYVHVLFSIITVLHAETALCMFFLCVCVCVCVCVCDHVTGTSGHGTSCDCEGRQRARGGPCHLSKESIVCCSGPPK